MSQQLKHLQDYYGWRLEEGDTSSAKLGWEDPVAHYERFRVLSSRLDLNYKSLLDVGSGLGDLWQHLSASGLLVRYCGVDILPDMVNRARARFPGVTFHCRDVISDPSCMEGSFDVVYSAGIFNLAAISGPDFLARAFGSFCLLAGEEVVISLLHAASPHREDQYCYFWPREVCELLARPGWSLDIAEGYLQNDFTLFARRAQD